MSNIIYDRSAGPALQSRGSEINYLLCRSDLACQSIRSNAASCILVVVVVVVVVVVELVDEILSLVQYIIVVVIVLVVFKDYSAMQCALHCSPPTEYLSIKSTYRNESYETLASWSSYRVSEYQEYI